MRSAARRSHGAAGWRLSKKTPATAKAAPVCPDGKEPSVKQERRGSVSGERSQGRVRSIQGFKKKFTVKRCRTSAREISQPIFRRRGRKKGDEGENDPDGPEVSERGIAVHDRIEPGRAKRLDRSENRKFGGGEKGHGRKKSRNGSGSWGFSHPARKDLRTQGIGFHRKHRIRRIQIFTKRT